MARRGFSFGMIVLLIVMAVVLVLVAKAWRSIAPEAIEVQGAVNAGPLAPHGQPEAVEALRKGELPRLGETQQRTDAHGARVQEALQAGE